MWKPGTNTQYIIISLIYLAVVIPSLLIGFKAYTYSWNIDRERYRKPIETQQKTEHQTQEHSIHIPDRPPLETTQNNDKLKHIRDRPALDTTQNNDSLKHVRDRDPIYETFVPKPNFQNQENYIRVSISPDNSYFIEDKNVEKESFLKTIAQAITENPNSAIYIEVSAHSSHKEMLFIDRSFMALNYNYKIAYVDE